MPAEPEGEYAASYHTANGSILTSPCKRAILARLGSRIFCGPGPFLPPFVRVFREGAVEAWRGAECPLASTTNPNRQPVVALNAADTTKEDGE